MSGFRKLSDNVFTSPQLSLEDIEKAQKSGIKLIINNRPDGEEPSAPQGNAIRKAAQESGLEYRAIPIGQSGFSAAHVDAMVELLNSADGPILAYCRSGTRSTFLWSLAQAKSGMSPDAIAESALKAGYDVSPIRAMIDMLASQ